MFFDFQRRHRLQSILPGLIVLFLAFCHSLPCFSQPSTTELNRPLTVQAGKVSYKFEVAETQAQAQKGLMYRTGLEPRTGMGFPFKPPELAVFWMKNTLIPLDMVFVRNHRIVRILDNVPPCPSDLGNKCPLYSSIVPVDWVLELPAGTAKADKLVKNEKLKFNYHPPSQAK